MSKRMLMVLVAAAMLGSSIGLPTRAQAGTPSSCSNGNLEPGELCDDGNSSDGDGCSSNCIPEVCGDGILELNGVAPDEECDDGNTSDGDGCSGECTCGPCGDGFVCGDEFCDDGNSRDGDDCDSDCGHTHFCGNGILDGSEEECDDGNTVAGDGCEGDCTLTPPKPHSPTRDDRTCVNAINKSWAGVIKATNKASGKCLKDVASGKITGTFGDCADAADLAKAFDRTTKNDRKKCVGKVDERMFAYVGDSTAINMAGLGAVLDAHADLLGSPANIVPKADKQNSRCQREVQKGLIRYLDALTADANKAKKDCLKGKLVPQCQLPPDLTAAMTAEGRKSPKALAGWNSKVEKKCSDASGIAAHFPGACSASVSYADLVTCSAQRAKCAFCASLNAADGLSADCASYSGDPSSCGLVKIAE